MVSPSGSSIKRPRATDKSKALAVWPRTLELLDRAGCADAFVRIGLKCDAVEILSGKESIARITLDGIASPFNYLLLIPQSESERLLEAHLESVGGKVERNVELASFAGPPSAWLAACVILTAEARRSRQAG